MKVAVIFDVLHLYYLPQYLPVYKKLIEKQLECCFVFYRNSDKNLQNISEEVIQQESIPVVWVDDWAEALSFYIKQAANWVVYGNAIENVEQIQQHSKTAMMLHGIGPKAVYYEMPETPPTVRFVEGQYRLNRLQKQYPNYQFYDSGYAKLDLVNDVTSQTTLASLNLDPSKQTLLYAPTFYPSSIELMGNDFPEKYQKFNIIIKPHYFSLTKSKYKKQRQLLMNWKKYSNVHLCDVEEYNLVPFMALSDVMISDASSAIFEFAALDKPVVWCDFYKLRWSYRGIFSYRFNNRVDDDLQYFDKVGHRVNSVEYLASALDNALKENKEKQQLRRQVIEKLVGKVDGNCASRIVEYLLNN